MRDAVVCEPLRTPVGGFGGALRGVPAHELAATVVRALITRTGLDPAVVDDVLLGHCYPTMEAPAIGRVVALDAGLPGDRDRAADRPPLRLGAAGRPLRGDAGAQRGVGGRARGRGRVDVERAVLLDGDALGRARRAGRHAARRARPRPRHRGRRALPRARRDDRDRGEPAPRVRHRPRRAGRVRRAQPPSSGRGAGRGPVRRRDRAGGRGRRRRAHPARHQHREARRAAADHGPRRPGGDGHGGQRVGAERRGRGLRRHAPGAGGGAGAAAVGPAGRVGCGRGAARDDGHRPGARHREGAGRGRSSRWPTWT